jgi:hypothetical protein
MVTLILWIAALLCFGFSALGITGNDKISIPWLGMLLFAAALWLGGRA